MLTVQISKMTTLTITQNMGFLPLILKLLRWTPGRRVGQTNSWRPGKRESPCVHSPIANSKENITR